MHLYKKDIKVYLYIQCDEILIVTSSCHVHCHQVTHADICEEKTPPEIVTDIIFSRQLEVQVKGGSTAPLLLLLTPPPLPHPIIWSVWTPDKPLTT